MNRGAMPPLLFHYTTQAGLVGIVKSNLLWATNALYLNDSSELRYGLSVARKCLDETKGMSPVVTEFLRRGRQLLDFEAILPNHQFYVCCFSEEPDLLS